MLSQIPNYVNMAFIATTLLTLYLVWRILKQGGLSSRSISLCIGGIVAWLVLHAAVALTLFYFKTVGQVPPPFALVILPTFLVIIYFFSTESGKAFMDRLVLVDLTWLSVVRIPVEIVLYWLFVFGAIPELMTFSGRNFDILAGLTAPFMALAFARQKLSRLSLLVWNFAGLGLLIFIILNALLSTPHGITPSKNKS